MSFPDVINLPLIPDEFVGKIGFAYPGSNPSYEIKVLTNEQNIEVGSVSFIDSSGMIFENIPFEITKIDGFENQFILGLEIPEGASKGSANFTLNFISGEQLTGIIEIIDSFKNVEIITIKNPIKRTELDKPVIEELISKASSSTKLTLFLKGKNFVSRQIFYTTDSSGRSEEHTSELQ